MAKTRKKNIYRCTKCSKRFGSSPQAAQHFAKHPSHRTDKQRQKHISNMRASQVVRDRMGVTKRRSSVYEDLTRTKHGVPQLFLPTKGMTTQNRQGTMKYCTECGTRKMPSHNYCGGCGGKL